MVIVLFYYDYSLFNQEYSFINNPSIYIIKFIQINMPLKAYFNLNHLDNVQFHYLHLSFVVNTLIVFFQIAVTNEDLPIYIEVRRCCKIVYCTKVNTLNFFDYYDENGLILTQQCLGKQSYTRDLLCSPSKTLYSTVNYRNCK